MDPFQKDIYWRIKRKLARIPSESPTKRLPVLPQIVALRLDDALASGVIPGGLRVPPKQVNGSFGASRSPSFPPVPTGNRFKSPSKSSFSSSLQGRDLGLAPNPGLADEIADRHWRIPERRIQHRNDRKIVMYLRRQLRRRMQQWYDDEYDSDEIDGEDERSDRVPKTLQPNIIGKTNAEKKGDIFNHYNDVGGRVSKEGSFIAGGLDASKQLANPQHSGKISESILTEKLEQVERTTSTPKETPTESKLTNGHAVATKGVKFAEKEFEIVNPEDRRSHRSMSDLSILSVSTERHTPIHTPMQDGQVPSVLPEIPTTTVPIQSNNNNNAEVKSPTLPDDRVVLPAIPTSTGKETENVTENGDLLEEDEERDIVDDEIQQIQERSISRGNTDLTRQRFTPVATPYPLPVGRSDTNDYIKLGFKDTVDSIVKGQLNVNCQIKKRIIRLYISSNISDGEAERTAVIEKVYPRLRHYCKERGYEFQLTDPNWGLKDNICDDHSHQELCLRELQATRQVSRGPNFVTFLSQKYDQSVLPVTVPEEEFKTFLSVIQKGKDRYLATHLPPPIIVETTIDTANEDEDNEDGKSGVSKATEAQKTQASEDTAETEVSEEKTQEKEDTSNEHAEREKTDREYDAEMAILNMWYKLDTNTVPPVYRLQTISSQYREINHRDAFKRIAAKQQWASQCRRLEAVFQLYIKEVTSNQDRIDEYFKSTIEREIEMGILDLDYKPFEEVQWFRRNITDMKYNLGDFNAKEYIDLLPGTSEVDPAKAERLRTIMEKRIPDRVSLANMHEYSVSWHKDGIKPDKTRGHLLYTDKMANDLFGILRSKIDHTIKQNTIARDAKTKLYDEVAQHSQFVRERSREFHGRKEILNKIKEYIRMGPRKPLVIHGKSGFGKTSIMAKAAKDAPSWIKSGVPAVIVRIIGVTAESLHIRQLLRSMSQQLCHIFGQDTSLVPQDYRGALNDFNGRLANAQPDRPLFIFLDSLDQLSDENNGRALEWLPRELPDNVFLIVSTLSEDKYDSFQTLKKLFKDGDNFVNIPELPESDAAFILEHLLAQEDRTLTDEQHDSILNAFKNCPTPLYLRLIFEESRLWYSYTSGKQIWIADSIRKVINSLLSRMEVKHGEPFVRRALGYITASCSGVTQSELLDLLSLDDLVLSDLSSTMALTARRCPPIAWMRLRHDLKWHIVERSADSEWTYRWSHTQLHEAAVDRYLYQKDKAPSYHTALSELFLGMWAEKKKPYPGNESGALRHVDDHALTHNVVSPSGKVKTLFNLRCLNELPHHLLNSNQFRKLKLKVLLNFEWLLAKLRATSLRAVLDDFHNALLVESGDKELKLVADSLQLSETALLRNPLELATQVVGRLCDIIRKDKPVSIGDPKKYPNMLRFIKQAKVAAIPGLIPSITCLTPPGDVLYDLLAGHTDVITAVTAASDGYIAITASKDKTMKLWDLRSGRVTKTIEGTGDQIHGIRMCFNNFYAVTSEIGCIRVWNTRTSQCVFKVDDYVDPASITAAGKNSELLVAFYYGENVMRSWDLEHDFKKLQDVKVEEGEGIHKDQSLCVSFNSTGDNVLYAFRSDNRAYGRNARSGQLIHSLKTSRESASITAVAISREYYIVSCRYQYMKLAEIYHLELFDTKKGVFLRFIKGCTIDRVTDLMINKVGSHALCLCTSADTNTTEIAVWNIETDEHKHLARHAKVSTMGVCMDLSYCLTASKEDRALRIWNLSRKINDREGGADKPKQREGISDILAMKHNPRYVVAKNIGNGPLCVWNVVKDKCAAAPIRIERGLVGEHDVVLLRNEKVIVLTDRGMSSVSEEPKPVYQTIYIYDLKTKKYERKLTGVFIVPSQAHEYRLLDGNLLMGLSDSRDHLICWSLVTGHVVQRIKTKFKEMERQQRLRKDDHGHFNGPTKEDRTKGLRRETTAMMTPWERRSETQTARQRRKDSEADDEKKRLDELKKEKENAIEQYIMSDDEKVIVCSYFAHHMCVFDVTTQTHTATLQMESSMLYLYNAAMTPTGSSLVHANYDDWDKVSYVTLWDLKTGQVRKRVKNEPNVCCIAISRDANRVVFGNEKNIIKVWDPMQKNSLRKIKGYEGMKLGVGSKMYLVNKGTQAVVFSGDISLWDLERNTLLALFTPDTRIQCMEVLLDGELIVVGLTDTSSVVTLKLNGRDIKPSKTPITAPEFFAETTGDTDDESEDEEEEAGKY
ncbi:uncharacterized protein LOC144441205 isoform X2 [Glandiceps talaboti]